jgi:outer membrane protein assembly factor BamD (BamD/ComL family)
MRKLALCFFAIFSFVNISALAEDFRRPIRTPAEATPEQKAILKEGIQLHDKGDYDGAIKKYDSILSINPDNVSAIYEVGFSYFAKQDYKKALEINEKGIEYSSDQLPQFYMQIASCSDHLGNWEKAIDIYMKVIKEFPQEHLVRFNLALTYSQHQKPDLAISNLKDELYLTPSHPTSHLLLGALFKQNAYRIPAIFALSRFLILEPQSGRSANALAGLQELINGGVVAKDEKNINIFIDPNAKKDEGDFDSLQMALSLVSAGRFLEKNANKTPVEKEVEQFRSFFQIMLEMVDKDQSKLKFTGKYYVPYFLAMHKQGYVETFVYLVHAAGKDKEVHDWLDKNMEHVRAFLEWDKKYQWPQKKG